MSKDSEVVDGTGAEPTAVGSESKTGQRGSATDADLRTEITELKQTLTNLTKMVQGDKDRAVKRVGERVDALEGNVREVLQLAQQKGMTVSDVLGEIDAQEDREMRMALAEMARSFREGKFPVEQTRQSAAQGVDVSVVLTELELDENDVRVQEFRSRQFKSEQEAWREAARLRKTIQNIQPTEADKPSEVGKTPRPAGKQDELMKEYREGSKGKFGRELILFKQHMREKGLEIS